MSETVIEWWTIAQRMAHWFETMRGPRGYGGPVVHWWRNCLQFTGAGLDWRYEGIIHAYLTMHERSGEARFLDHAVQAGDDLLYGQLQSGNFRHSAFELNPYTGGTPHEAAADSGLLQLALTLRERGDVRADDYAAAAQRNLEAYWVGQMWSDADNAFRDHHQHANFAPNKACTLCEALFLLAEWIGDESIIERYVLPTLEAVLALQIAPDANEVALRGGIAQNTYGKALVRKYFPYYVGRCIPALLLAHDYTGKTHYKEAALAAGAFMLHWRADDGSFPQVVYADGRVNRYQQWIAGVGDMLRALDMLVTHGFEYDPVPSQRWLLGGINSNGGVRTAHGFEAKAKQHLNQHASDFRDILSVCGWADKALRYVALQVATDSTSETSSLALGPVMVACRVGGRDGYYEENDSAIVVRRGDTIWYRWDKGQAWATTCDPRLAWL